MGTWLRSSPKANPYGSWIGTGEDLTDRRYIDCDFRDIDLTEASGNPTCESCRFSNCRFNAARFEAAAFVGC